MGSFSVSCRFRNVDNGFVWIFSSVYGPFSRDGRSLIWEELSAIRGLWEDPWCIGEDFNVIRFPSERSRHGRLNHSMRQFSKFINEMELIDLPLLRSNFTWSNGFRNQNLTLLDRFLVSQDWIDYHGNVVQLKLPRPASNCASLLLDCGGMRRGPTPFHFENLWLKAEGFQNLMEGWWQGMSFKGSANFIISRKFKEIKSLLKAWNGDCFARLDLNKKLTLSQVEDWDRMDEVRELTVEEVEAKKEAKDFFKKLVTLEEIHWRQKSRETWLKAGDRNTGFFHRMATPISGRTP